MRAPHSILTLQDAAVATSGDYRHWVEVGRTRLSHTMDARTGGPLNNRVASVTVLAGTCMEADAWATALMVMGEAAGAAFADAQGLNALFILRTESGLAQRPVGSLCSGPLMGSDGVPLGRIREEAFVPDANLEMAVNKTLDNKNFLIYK